MDSPKKSRESILKGQKPKSLESNIEPQRADSLRGLVQERLTGHFALQELIRYNNANPGTQNASRQMLAQTQNSNVSSKELGSCSLNASGSDCLSPLGIWKDPSAFLSFPSFFAANFACIAAVQED